MSKVTVNSIIQKMYAYQKKHNIEKLCCENSILLYYLCEHHFKINIKIVCGYTMQYRIVDYTLETSITEHVWCEYDGKILEPSYEYFLHQPRIKYVKNFCDLQLDLTYCDKEEKRTFITKRLQFEKDVKRTLKQNGATIYIVDVLKYLGYK